MAGKVRNRLSKSGYILKDCFISVTETSALLHKIEQKLPELNLPRIYRQCRSRDLDYYVIDGLVLGQYFPELDYLSQSILELLKQYTSMPLALINNKKAAININITQPGGEYRWHFDRNAFTAILYLNDVSNGETELIPNCRRHLGTWKHIRLQRVLDSITIKYYEFFSKKNRIYIAPQAGRLLLMRGDRCLHSVHAVQGMKPRYNLLFAFDQPNVNYKIEENLDRYIYSTDKVSIKDPNYVK